MNRAEPGAPPSTDSGLPMIKVHCCFEVYIPKARTLPPHDGGKEQATPVMCSIGCGGGEGDLMRYCSPGILILLGALFEKN